MSWTPPKTGSKTIPALPGECIVAAGAREKAEELGIIIADRLDPQPRRLPRPCPGRPSPRLCIREVCTLLKSRMASGVEPGKLEHLVREVDRRLRRARCGVAGHGGPVCFPCGGRVFSIQRQPPARQRRRPCSRVWKKPWCARLSAAVAVPSSPAATWNGRRRPSAGAGDSHEIGIVIEGDLRLTVDRRRRKPGDMVYFPKGVQVIPPHRRAAFARSVL